MFSSSRSREYTARVAYFRSKYKESQLFSSFVACCLLHTSRTRRDDFHSCTPRCRWSFAPIRRGAKRGRKRCVQRLSRPTLRHRLQHKHDWSSRRWRRVATEWRTTAALTSEMLTGRPRTAWRPAVWIPSDFVSVAPVRGDRRDWTVQDYSSGPYCKDAEGCRNQSGSKQQAIAASIGLWRLLGHVYSWNQFMRDALNKNGF